MPFVRERPHCRVTNLRESLVTLGRLVQTTVAARPFVFLQQWLSIAESRCLAAGLTLRLHLTLLAACSIRVATAAGWET
jgi:hypothetical protein